MIGVFVPWGDRGSVGYVIDGDGCHIWVGGTTHEGYGVGRDPRTKRQRMIHRVRYEMEVGPVPEGMQLDHVCDNGAGGCCNPRHVRPVTPRENVLRSDGIASRNAAKTHCVRGHPLSGSNLRMRRGCRTCRKCQLMYSAAWRARRDRKVTP